jgi:beta-lactamase regulating signal transducer with metallopeptidase domain
MNSIIEHLDQLGGQFLTFAWPMFWQSSLLIGLVYAGDRLLARKVRAAVRHALWLVVLAKLLLPPSLALPTGAAWWLFPTEPAVKAPAPRNFVVSVGDAPALENFVPVSVPVASPPVKPDLAGWALLATAAVSVGLMGWLLFRGGQVARMVRRAAPAGELAPMLDQVQRAAGLRRPLRLKMVEDRTSPAVAGLLRPVILLPRVVAEQLSAEQLRAVLLHEAMHLRRCDLWTNCAQALLQSLYWWHPLVWLANGRLRRLREEAVDDAVMLALADGAEIYAPTLLEVARLAFRRPLLSLGLVGILESRSALRQRIERLVAFRAPRRAGLSLVSLLAILGFSAVALPMGQGPAPATGQPLPAANQHGATDATPGQPFPRPLVLIQAEIYQVPPDELKQLVSDLPTVKVPGHGANHSPAGEETWWSASPAQYLELSGRLKASGLKPEQRPRIQTCSGKPAQFFVGDILGKTEILRGTEIDCLPVVRDGKIQLTFTSEVMDGTAGARLTNRVEGDWELPSHGGLVVPMPNDTKHRVFFLTAEVLTNTLQAQSPPGSSNQAVKATEANLDNVKALPQGRSPVQTPEVHIKARFIEVPADAIGGLKWLVAATNLSDGGITALLTSENAHAVLQALETRKDIETLGEPEVTVSSGREFQIRQTREVTIVTNTACYDILTNGNDMAYMSPQTTPIDIGPILDAVPRVMDDHYTIDLKMTASLTEFLGYAAGPTNAFDDRWPNAVTNAGGERVNLPVVLPAVQIRSSSTHVNLRDGQTVVLWLSQAQARQVAFNDQDNWREALVAQHIEQATKKNGSTEVLVFITPTLIDPAGNRIHSDDDLLLAPGAFPPQPAGPK